MVFIKILNQFVVSTGMWSYKCIFSNSPYSSFNMASQAYNLFCQDCSVFRGNFVLFDTWRSNKFAYF